MSIGKLFPAEAVIGNAALISRIRVKGQVLVMSPPKGASSPCNPILFQGVKATAKHSSPFLAVTNYPQLEKKSGIVNERKPMIPPLPLEIVWG